MKGQRTASRLAAAGRPRILQCDVDGLPRSWISPKAAVKIISKNKDSWSIGSMKFVYGGMNRILQEISTIELPEIIGTIGKPPRDKLNPNRTPELTNAGLFIRDEFTCQYCGFEFPPYRLTRDHVKARSKGGPDTWNNAVAACKKCNQQKGDRDLADIPNMDLIAVPFTPNMWEAFALKQTVFTDEQIDFLGPQFKSDRMLDRLCA